MELPTNDDCNTPQKRRHRRGLKRVQVACERCRTRKHKVQCQHRGHCEGNLPACHSCLKVGARCVYTDRFGTSAREQECEEEIDRLRQRIRDLESQQQQQQQQQQSRSVLAAQNDYSLIDSTTLLLDHPSATSGQATTIAEDVDAVSRGMASDAKFVGESSGSFLGQILQTMLLKSGYKHDHRRFPMHVSDGPLVRPASPSLVPLPSPERAKMLLDNFVRNRWPSYPCLHIPTFDVQHMASVIEKGYSAHPSSLFIVLMVMALGALDVEGNDVHTEPSHYDYFTTASSHYMDSAVSQDDLHTVQALTLLGIYALSEARRSPNAWHVAGQAMRMSIDLGYHRTLPAANTLDLELRKRMFWCAYCLDRNFSIALGRPFAIRDEDIAVSLPEVSSNDAREPDEPDLSTFVHVIRLRQIQSRVQQTLYPVSPPFSLDPAQTEARQVELAKELEAWLKDAPQTHGTHFQAPEWPRIAHAHTNLLIYRPSPLVPVVTAEALRMCADSALTLITSYSTLYAKNKMIHTWIALHSIFMAAVTMLYTLWVSSDLRRTTRKSIVRSNINTVLALFDALDDTWPLASRCRSVIESLGNATVALFDPQHGGIQSSSGTDDKAITDEFMQWLTTCQASDQPFHPNGDANELSTNQGGAQDVQFPSVANLDDLFFESFDVDFPQLPYVDS